LKFSASLPTSCPLVNGTASHVSTGRSFDVDVLQCPRCDGRLRVLSTITDEDALARILPKLGLPVHPPIAARTRDPTDLLEKIGAVSRDYLAATLTGRTAGIFVVAA
jgi:hypothetical protein